MAYNWPTKRCAEHDYEGIPPCPWRDCKNGHDRAVWIAYQVVGFEQLKTLEARTGLVDIDGERIFLRAYRRADSTYYWRELIDKPAEAAA